MPYHWNKAMSETHTALYNKHYNSKYITIRAFVFNFFNSL